MTEKELILTSILNCRREELYLNESQLSKEEEERFNYLVKQRKNGFALQYLLGFTEFMGIRLKVDSRALIPRPETEILVEQTLNVIKDFNLTAKNILDIGTGSGNIAISIANFFPEVKIVSVDISKDCLNLAKENAILNKVDSRIQFLKADVLEESFLSGYGHNFDLIISNPPYIKAGDLLNLPEDVQKEPRIALEAGEDGLKFYRRIIPKAVDLLKEKGLIAFEMGYNQSEPIKNMLEENNFSILKIIPDYSGIERVVIARLI